MEVREEAARALALFASKRDSQAHLVRIGVVPKLVRLVRGTDAGGRRYGVLGLGNLAVVTQNHQTLFEAGGVSSLLAEAVYAAEDLETRRCVAFALNNIASYQPNHRACEKAGVLRPLVHLLRDPDRDTHLQAAFAIRQLSVTARCRSQLVEMKGLAPLLRRGILRRLGSTAGVRRWRVWPGRAVRETDNPRAGVSLRTAREGVAFRTPRRFLSPAVTGWAGASASRCRGKWPLP